MEGCRIQTPLLFLTQGQEVHRPETRLLCHHTRDIKEGLLLDGLARTGIPTGEVQMRYRQYMETGGWRMTTGSVGGTTTSHESTESEGDVWREVQRRAALPASCWSTPKTVPFSRRTNSLDSSRQNPSLINGCGSTSQQDRRYEGMNAMVGGCS